MDIWQISLDHAGELGALRELLDPREKARADRFLSGSVARRFIVSHAAVRRILSACTGQQAEDLEFEFNAHGKPALRNGPSFSLSHSGDLALCAVAASGELGVDVEQCREARFLDLAQRFFSRAETEQLLGLHGDDLKAGFYACWTQKEAYIKAKGLGLALPLDRFSVELRPGFPAGLTASAFAPGDETRFRFRHVPVPAGFAAAVALGGRDEGAPAIRRWNPDATG